MHRRGFLGLLGKLLEVGAAIGVAPALLAPAKGAVDGYAVARLATPAENEEFRRLIGWGGDGTAYYADDKPEITLAS